MSPHSQSAPNVIAAGSGVWNVALDVARIQDVFSVCRFALWEPWFYQRLFGLTLILVPRGGIELGAGLEDHSPH